MFFDLRSVCRQRFSAYARSLSGFFVAFTLLPPTRIIILTNRWYQHDACFQLALFSHLLLLFYHDHQRLWNSYLQRSFFLCFSLCTHLWETIEYQSACLHWRVYKTCSLTIDHLLLVWYLHIHISARHINDFHSYQVILIERFFQIDCFESFFKFFNDWSTFTGLMFTVAHATQTLFAATYLFTSTGFFQSLVLKTSPNSSTA